jgi:hypothetical protein
VAEVERAAPAVVEEQAVGAAIAVTTDVKRNRFVDRVARRCEAERISVPVNEGRSPPVKRAGLVAQREDVLVDRQRLAEREPAPVKTKPIGCVGDDRLAVEVGHAHRQHRRVDVHGERAGRESVRRRVNRDAFGPNLARHCPACIFREGSPVRDPHSHDAVGQRGCADSDFGVAGFGAVRERLQSRS